MSTRLMFTRFLETPIVMNINVNILIRVQQMIDNETAFIDRTIRSNDMSWTHWNILRALDDSNNITIRWVLGSLDDYMLWGLTIFIIFRCSNWRRAALDGTERSSPHIARRKLRKHSAMNKSSWDRSILSRVCGVTGIISSKPDVSPRNNYEIIVREIACLNRNDISFDSLHPLAYSFPPRHITISRNNSSALINLCPHEVTCHDHNKVIHNPIWGIPSHCLAQRYEERALYLSWGLVHITTSPLL